MNSGTSLVVQWLRLCAPSAKGPGSIPGWGTRSPMLQLRPGKAKFKIIIIIIIIKNEFSPLDGFNLLGITTEMWAGVQKSTCQARTP